MNMANSMAAAAESSPSSHHLDDHPHFTFMEAREYLPEFRGQIPMRKKTSSSTATPSSSSPPTTAPSTPTNSAATATTARPSLNELIDDRNVANVGDRKLSHNEAADNDTGEGDSVDEVSASVMANVATATSLDVMADAIGGDDQEAQSNVSFS